MRLLADIASLDLFTTDAGHMVHFDHPDVVRAIAENV
jgi:carboxypeptidase C (cathepsin A)